MRLTRNYVPDALAVGGTLPLPEEVTAHLLRVLRLQVGDACVLFNGDGHDYDARITQLGKRDAHVQIIAQRRLANESPLRITLLQGVARGEKMDWILQKATELGAAQFLPVFSERSEVKLDGPRADKRLAHWRAVVIAACEQSGRATVPEVATPLALAQALAQAAQRQDGPAFLLDPLAENSLMDVRTQRGAQQPDVQQLDIQRLEACTLAIGPEGGWSSRDREQLHAAGFQGVRLGPRILRTETAGLAAISALQLLAGDFQ